MNGYRGYEPEYVFDRATGGYVGFVAGIRDVVHFEAADLARLEREFHASVDAYLEHCAAKATPPERPFEGRVALPLPRELHRAAFEAARREGMLLDDWLTKVVREAANRPVDVRRRRAAG